MEYLLSVGSVLQITRVLALVGGKGGGKNIVVLCKDTNDLPWQKSTQAASSMGDEKSSLLYTQCKKERKIVGG